MGRTARRRAKQYSTFAGSKGKATGAQFKAYVDTDAGLKRAWAGIQNPKTAQDRKNKEYWELRGATSKEAFGRAHAAEDEALRSGKYPQGDTKRTVGSKEWKEKYADGTTRFEDYLRGGDSRGGGDSGGGGGGDPDGGILGPYPEQNIYFPMLDTAYTAPNAQDWSAYMPAGSPFTGGAQARYPQAVFPPVKPSDTPYGTSSNINVPPGGGSSLEFSLPSRTFRDQIPGLKPSGTPSGGGSWSSAPPGGGFSPLPPRTFRDPIPAGVHGKPFVVDDQFRDPIPGLLPDPSGFQPTNFDTPGLLYQPWSTEYQQAFVPGNLWNYVPPELNVGAPQYSSGGHISVSDSGGGGGGDPPGKKPPWWETDPHGGADAGEVDAWRKEHTPEWPGLYDHHVTPSMKGGGYNWDPYGGEKAAIGSSGYVSLDALTGMAPSDEHYDSYSDTVPK